MSKLGIVSLQRKPPDVLNWIRYHRDVGITHFYIWLEDSDDLVPVLQQAARDYGVQMYTEIGKVDRAAEDNYSDLMTRQKNFVNRMLEKGRKDGVDWLFHIDDDEVLHPRSDASWADVMKKVAPSCASVHMTNWEGFSPAQPAGAWLSDSGVRYMTSTCKHLYAAYTNGKSASRTTRGQTSWGPHHFSGGKECELSEADGVVLHHDSLAMGPEDLPPKTWVEKNLLRAHSNMASIPFEAAKESVKAVTSGSPAAQAYTLERFRSQKGERFQSCPVTESVQLPSYGYH